MQNSNDRKQMIQKGFDTVAAGYDHPSLSFFPETAKRLVEHLQLNPTDHLLDVCTGTGCIALTAAEKLTQGKVFGIDLSSGMLQQVKKTARDGGNAGNAGDVWTPPLSRGIRYKVKSLYQSTFTRSPYNE